MEYLKSNLKAIAFIGTILAFIIGTAGYPPNYELALIILVLCYSIGLYKRDALINSMAFVAAVMVLIFNNF